MAVSTGMIAGTERGVLGVVDDDGHAFLVLTQHQYKRR